MSVWIIDPHDPLIFRDGRPFSATPGARAQSLAFPFPSTIAGSLRHLAGLDEQGRFTIEGEKKLETLVKQLKIRGPILVELTRDGELRDKQQWLVPAPSDALVREEETQGQGHAKRYPIVQLMPMARDEQVKTDLDQRSPLLLVGQKDYKKEKPNKKAPHYWYWERFETWLRHPELFSKDQPVTLTELGHNGPSEQGRVHVSIDPNRRAGWEQYLFETVGMEFSALVRQADAEQEVEPRLHLQHARPLGLAVIVDDESPYLRAGKWHQRLSSLGGERRLVGWRKSSASFQVPACPEEVKQAILKDKRCRIVLLTPALFDKGYYPERCLRSPHIEVKLQAIKVERPQVVSGFDMANGSPRGSRRLVPAGTVLFLDFEGESSKGIEDWIEDTWMHCLTEGSGDEPQERNDGFGLAVLGTWPRPATD